MKFAKQQVCDQTQGDIREALAQQFISLDRSPQTLTNLAQQFTMSTFSGETREQLSQQFTQSIFQTNFQTN